MSLDSNLRRYLFFGSLVLLAAVGAACNSSQEGSPLGLLQQSYDRSKDIETFRAHMELEMVVPGESAVMTVDMETGRDGRVSTAMSIDASGYVQSIEMIVAEPYVYLKAPGQGWTQMSAAAMAESSGQPLEAVTDPTALYSSLFPIEDVPWDLYVVRSLGTEDVDGVQTEHLSIEFDFQEIWGYLDEAQRQRLLRAGPDSEANMEEALGVLEVGGVEVWIDDQGYSRRAVMEIGFGGEALASLGSEEMSMKMDIRTFDINEEIIIDLPEGYEG